MSLKEKFLVSFGSRRVLITYLICFLIIILTITGSIISASVSDEYTVEKMIEHIFLCIVALMIINVPVVMQSRFKFQIPSFLHILFAIFMVAHFVLGEVYRFFDYVFLFDKVLHTIGGVTVATLGFSIVYGFTKTESGSVKLPPVFVALFSFCFAITILVLWEVFEYGMDSLLSTNMQRWKDGLTEIDINGVMHLITNSGQGNGLIDTMIDLIVGILGAGAICITGCILLKKYPDNTKFYIMKKLEFENKENDT